MRDYQYTNASSRRCFQSIANLYTADSPDRLLTPRYVSLPIWENGIKGTRSDDCLLNEMIELIIRSHCQRYASHFHMLRPAKRNLDLTRRLYLPRLPLSLYLPRLRYKKPRLLTDRPKFIPSLCSLIIILFNIRCTCRVSRYQDQYSNSFEWYFSWSMSTGSTMLCRKVIRPFIIRGSR